PKLYQVIKTTFGGTGGTFNLPDMRGRVPLHYGPGRPFAKPGGVAQVTLDVSTLPQHSHLLWASSQPGNTVIPNGQQLAQAAAATPFYQQPDQANIVAMDSNEIGATGGVAAHENMAPYLPLQFCIATDNVT